MKQETIINKLKDIKDNIDYLDSNETKSKLTELINELKLDTIDTYKVGKFNANAYFKRFLKQVDDYRTVYKNVHKQRNGKYGICDGYKYIQFEDENDKIAQALYDEKDDPYFIQYDEVLRDRGEVLEINTDYLEKVIAYNKVNKLKGKEKIPYIDRFDKDHYIGFNAEWLMELLQLNNVKIITLGKSHLSPTEIKSEKYSCILLPIIMKDGQENTETALKLKEQFIKEVK